MSVSTEVKTSDIAKTATKQRHNASVSAILTLVIVFNIGQKQLWEGIVLFGKKDAFLLKELYR
jgi:hypothetical protein